MIGVFKKHSGKLKVLCLVAGTAATAYLIYRERDSVGTSLSMISIGSIVVVTLLQLVSSALKVEAWNTCVNSSSFTKVSRSHAHASSAPLFLSGSFFPAYIGNIFRMLLLKRTKETSDVKISHMLVGEIVITIVQVVITGLIIMSAIPLGIPMEYALATLALLLVGLLGAWLAKDQIAKRSEVLNIQTLALREKKHGAKVALLLFVAIALQPIRYWICLKALGDAATPSDALAVYLLTTILSSLPVGTSAAGIGATAAVIGASAGGMGIATSMGIVLAGTSLLAACIYSLVTVYVYLPERHQKIMRKTALIPHRCFKAVFA